LREAIKCHLKKALKKVTIARAPASDAGLLTRVGIDYYSLHPKNMQLWESCQSNY
jgi:hypothetical protein